MQDEAVEVLVVVEGGGTAQDGGGVIEGHLDSQRESRS